MTSERAFAGSETAAVSRRIFLALSASSYSLMQYKRRRGGHDREKGAEENGEEHFHARIQSSFCAHASCETQIWTLLQPENAPEKSLIQALPACNQRVKAGVKNFEQDPSNLCQNCDI